MEQGNNTMNTTEQALDSFYAEVKAELMKEAETYLNSTGIRVFEKNYSPKGDIMKILNNFKDSKAKYDSELSRINQRYSSEVASSKTKVLQEDYKYEVTSYLEELDKVEEHERTYKQKEIARLQGTKEYAEARAMAFNMLGLLKGVDVGMDVAMELVEPFVRVADLKSLRLAELMLGKDTDGGKIVSRTAYNIQQDLAHSDSKYYIDSAKEFIQRGEVTPRLMQLIEDMKADN